MVLSVKNISKLALILILALFITTQAAVRFVSPTGSDNFDGLSRDFPLATVQKAINLSSEADEVVLLPGEYVGTGNNNINFSGKAITVRSDNPESPDIVAGTIIDCQNSAQAFLLYSGEGINSEIYGLTIINGYSSANGGAIDGNPQMPASPMIINCVFFNCSAYNNGGVIANVAGSINYCTFQNNHAEGLGGAIFHQSDSAIPSFYHCKFMSNIAFSGGAIAGSDTGIVLNNNLIINNSASYRGGAIYSYDSDIYSYNNTIANNSATSGGALSAESYYYPISLSFTNDIIWGNTAEFGPAFALFGLPVSVSGELVVTYSDIEGGRNMVYFDTVPNSGYEIGWNTDNNINTPPLFVSTEDYELQEYSPCRNSGTDSSFLLPYDLNFQPRLSGPSVDMGAYEYQEAGVEYPVPSYVLAVRQDAPAGGDGTSWDTAFNSLQDALAAADAGISDIWVAAGTYYPDRGKLVTAGDRTATFQLRANLNILGGFMGTESDVTERNSSENITILSGDLGHNDDPNGTPESFAYDLTRNDNSYHVVTGGGPSAVFVFVDSVTIEGGQANAAGYNQGGAIYNNDGVLHLYNCTARNNYAEQGGAIANLDCNSVEESSQVFISGCNLHDNSAEYYGGAVYNSNSLVEFYNTALYNNYSAGQGGAVYNMQSKYINFYYCKFSDNKSEGNAGAVYNNSCSPYFSECDFIGNSAYNDGGASYHLSSNSIYQNCLFSGNSTYAGSGGAIYNDKHPDHPTSYPVFRNCTIADNYASIMGGAISENDGSVSTITSCIIWNNSAYDYPMLNGTSIINYSCLQTPYSGTGNISTDPFFAQNAGLNAYEIFVPGDYHLQSPHGRWNDQYQEWYYFDTLYSPCIDAGDPCDLGYETEEFYSGLRINMGAYGGTYYASHSAPAPTYYNLTTEVTGGDGYLDPDSGSFEEGTLVTIYAHPNYDLGWQVAAWNGVPSHEVSHTVYMSEDQHVTVTFEPVVITTYFELFTEILAGEGRLTPSYGTYEAGTVVNIQAIPESGWQVSAWNEMASSNSTYQVIMDSNQVVSVKFELIPSPPQPVYYSLSTNVQGQGSVSPANGTYESGAQFTLTATPAEGWQIAAWNGTASSDTTYAVTMNSNRTVQVSFEEIPVPEYTLTTSITGGTGSITPGGTYVEGTVVNLSITPDAAYKVLQWSGSDNAPAAGSLTEVVTLNSDRNVSVQLTARTGAVSASIIPQPAAQSGARWQVNGSSDQTSGTAVDGLSILGSHTVTFTNVPGWTTPEPVTVTVNEGQTTSVSGTYIQTLPAEPETGSLRFLLTSYDVPLDPAAAWSLDGSVWHSSGHTTNNLEPGSYSIQFADVIGWTSPLEQNVNIQAAQDTITTAQYIKVVGAQQPEVGSLTVEVLPASVSAAWRIGNGSWQSSTQTISDLEAGTYQIEFGSAGEDWISPAAIATTIFADTNTTETATYIYIPDIVYVSNEGSDRNSGSESDPVKTIQRGIDLANLGGTVIIAEGTYSGSGNRDLNCGGKAVTIQSAAGPEGCVIDCSGTEASPRRGFIFENGEFASTVIKGLTITNGYANVGGGIFCTNDSSPRIENCVISNNTSKYSGAGVRVNSSSPVIVNCTVTGNTALMTGGGIFCDSGSSPTVQGCLIKNNLSQGCGGGVYVYTGSNLVISNSLIADNTANSCGGGLYLSPASNAQIDFCTIAGNTANIGAALRVYECQPTITNSIIAENTTLSGGSQIGNYDAQPTFVYCDITGSTVNKTWLNSVGVDGGGNLDIDPLFSDGQYHLGTASPCIDAANASLTCTEPAPNGNRANLGYCGNTSNASPTIDSDGDGLSDPQETRWSLNLNSIDSDNDGLTDYQEAASDGDDQNYNPFNIATQTGTDLNANSSDTDGDLIGDYTEAAYDGNGALYNPYPAGGDLCAVSVDTDGDGIDDTCELRYPSILNPLDPTDAAIDSDGDGYSNLIECRASSDPTDLNSLPPAFAFDFQIAKLRYGTEAALPYGLATLTILPFGQTDISTINFVTPSGTIALPVREGLTYDQYDLTGLTKPTLAEIEGALPAGPYTIELTLADSSTQSVTFQHWYSAYPEFAQITSPSDLAVGVNTEPIITWTGVAPDQLTIFDATTLATAFDVPVSAGGSYTVSAGILSTDTAYELALSVPSQLAPYLASTTLARFDTSDTTTVIFVDNSATAGANDGTSWANAFTDLQDALAEATAGAEIWVAVGTYFPGVNPEDAFFMVDNVNVYGGFAGVETSRHLRDGQSNLTILSGQIADEVNSYQVVIGADAAIDGFTITAGRADLDDPDAGFDIGGGLYCVSADTIVNNCTFADNYGIYGGAVCALGDSNLTLSNCQLLGNRAAVGGALISADSNVNLTNCLLAANVAEDGGAIYASFGNFSMTNCTVVGNQADYFGGALLAWNASAFVTNTIVYDNFASAGAQIAIGDAAHLAVSASNIEGGLDEINRDSGCTLTWNNDNIDRLPRFVDRGGWDDDDNWIIGDYRLTEISDSIDAGDNEAITGITVDLAGNPRTYNYSSVDIGAYEFQGVRFIPAVTPLEITRFKLKTGGQSGYGSFKIEGLLSIDPATMENADSFLVRVGPFEHVVDIIRDGVRNSGDRYRSSQKLPNGSSFKIKLDVDAGTFTLEAKDVDLLGITSPVEITIAIGGYFEAVGSVETEIPLSFWNGYADALNVEDVSLKLKSEPGKDSLKISGQISLAQAGLNIAEQDITINWGGFQVTVPAIYMAQNSPGVFQYNRPRGSDGPVWKFEINLNDCKYKIELKNATLGDQGSEVNFSLGFADFAQGQSVTL